VHCLWVETVLEPACPDLNAVEPATGPQGAEQLVIVVLYDGDGLAPTPGPKDLLDGWKSTPDDLFRRPYDPSDGFPVLSSGIATPHSDTTRQNALYGATVEVHKPSCASVCTMCPVCPSHAKVASSGVLQHRTQEGSE